MARSRKPANAGSGHPCRRFLSLVRTRKPEPKPKSNILPPCHRPPTRRRKHPQRWSPPPPPRAAGSRCLPIPSPVGRAFQARPHSPPPPQPHRNRSPPHYAAGHPRRCRKPPPPPPEVCSRHLDRPLRCLVPASPAVPTGDLLAGARPDAASSRHSAYPSHTHIPPLPTRPHRRPTTTAPPHRAFPIRRRHPRQPHRRPLSRIPRAKPPPDAHAPPRSLTPRPTAGHAQID